ncbi:unnamed protein product [Aureobasidium pullulans]|nr:unnamed protein product [Aureobasidium pullulans]
MRVYAAPARTRGDGGNFNITQAAGRSAAIDNDSSRVAALLKDRTDTQEQHGIE